MAVGASSLTNNLIAQCSQNTELMRMRNRIPDCGYQCSDRSRVLGSVNTWLGLVYPHCLFQDTPRTLPYMFVQQQRSHIICEEIIYLGTYVTRPSTERFGPRDRWDQESGDQAQPILAPEKNGVLCPPCITGSGLPALE